MTNHLDQVRQASSDPLEDPVIMFVHTVRTGRRGRLRVEIEPNLHNTCVTKIGLIDLDDLTEEDERFTRGQRQHKLHGRSVGLADAIYQNALGSD